MSLPNPLRPRTLPALLLAIALLGPPAPAQGASAYRLPEAWCDGGRIFDQGFEGGAPSDPSAGTGGAFPGDQTRAVFVPTTGTTRSYFLHVPDGYDPERAHPLLVVLHGAAGSQAAVVAAAQAMRALFQPTSQAGGVIVAALPAAGTQGGWLPGADHAFIAAALADIQAHYRIERSRIHLWGFSAGAHFGYDVALRDTGRYAALAVKAGALDAYAGPGAPGQAARRLPVAIRTGSSDPLLPYARLDRDRFLAAGWQQGLDLDYSEPPGGHVADAADAQAAWAGICRWAVLP
jgi:poly(3-hydroxybutyrate) depolymerase